MLGIATAAATAYLLCGALLYAYQRQLIFHPDETPLDASKSTIAGLEIRTIATADGEQLKAAFIPRDGERLILYFHGNARSLAHRAPRLRQLASLGSVLAIDYRGFGGSTGSVSEAGILRDGEAAFAYARQLGFNTGNILVYGESLGTVVAISVAAQAPVRALVLDSAFSSVADIAADRYWMFPVRFLLKDHFDSASRLPQSQAPLLMLHGKQDQVVPLTYGERLFQRATSRKTLSKADGAGHLVLDYPKALDFVADWLRALPPLPAS